MTAQRRPPAAKTAVPTAVAAIPPDRVKARTLTAAAPTRAAQNRPVRAVAAMSDMVAVDVRSARVPAEAVGCDESWSCSWVLAAGEMSAVRGIVKGH